MAENLLGHWLALQFVAIEESVQGQAPLHEGEFPGQIDRILDAGVHSLAAGRAVNVSRVAGEEDAALAKVGCVAEGDAKAGHPVRIGDGGPGGATFSEPA